MLSTHPFVSWNTKSSSHPISSAVFPCRRLFWSTYRQLKLLFMVVRKIIDSMEFSFSQRPKGVDVTIGSPRRSWYDSTPEQSTSSNGRDQTKYKARVESGIILLRASSLISFPFKLPSFDSLRSTMPAPSYSDKRSFPKRYHFVTRPTKSCILF